MSRGGDKLAAALARFAIDPRGRTALDAGASTGGFTDCLLQGGASAVFAVDVGRGQLHQRLRTDPRVVSCERVDVRDVTLATVGGSPVDLVTADLSFISLRRAIPVLTGEVAAPGAPMVLLVKPQFEAGRAEATRGRGVIRDPEVHRRTLYEVAGALGAAGADIMGAMPSPLTGAAGNIEFLLHAEAPGTGPASRGPTRTGRVPIDQLDRALAEAQRAGAEG